MEHIYKIIWIDDKDNVIEEFFDSIHKMCNREFELRNYRICKHIESVSITTWTLSKSYYFDVENRWIPEV